MKCNYCGKEIPDFSAICPECGANLAAQSQPPAFSQPAPFAGQATFAQQQPPGTQNPFYGQQDGYQDAQQSYPQQYPSQYQQGYSSMEDPGEDDARKAKIFGILSIFIFHIIFGIIAIVKAKSYSRHGSGAHESDAKIGKICGIIGLVSEALVVVLVFVLSAAGIFSFFSTTNSDYPFSESGFWEEADDEGDDSGYFNISWNEDESTDSATAIDGEVGDYVVTIKDYKITADHEGASVLFVTYSFTNNSDKASSFILSVRDTLFQNGVELGAVYVSYGIDDYDAESKMKTIQPGVSFDVQCLYKLNDTTSPVEVQLSKLFSSDAAVTYTLDIAG